MQEERWNKELTGEIRKRQLRLIVIGHLLFVITFFVAFLLLGNFA